MDCVRKDCYKKIADDINSEWAQNYGLRKERLLTKKIADYINSKWAQNYGLCKERMLQTYCLF